MREYQNAILKHHGETPNETHDKINKTVFDVFNMEYETVHFKWSQQFNFDGLWGRAAVQLLFTGCRTSQSRAVKIGAEIVVRSI